MTAERERNCLLSSPLDKVHFSLKYQRAKGKKVAVSIVFKISCVLQITA